MYVRARHDFHPRCCHPCITIVIAPFTFLAGTAPEIDYYLPFLVFSVGVFLFELYLDVRQHHTLTSSTGPPAQLLEQAHKIDASNVGGDDADAPAKPKSIAAELTEKFDKSKAYNVDKMAFGTFSKVVNTALALAILHLGGFPWLWDYCCGVSARYAPLLKGWLSPATVTCVVFLLVDSAKDIVLGVPLAWYKDFVLEERHGFNKKTQRLFWADLVKNFFLGHALNVPLMLGLVAVIDWGGPRFPYYCSAFLCTFSLLYMTIFPVWIQPLFNDYIPIVGSDDDDADAAQKKRAVLRRGTEALAKRLDFPLTKLFEVDGSKRSSHSNAYLYGFYKNKRIVIFDTLIKQATVPQILGVLAHELGHWRRAHTLKMFCLQQPLFLAMFTVFGRFKDDASVFGSFGFGAPGAGGPCPAGHFVGLMLFLGFMWAPLSTLQSFLTNLFVRRIEFEADEFAVGLGYVKELKTGLTRISLENLSAFDVDPWYSTYHYSHPPLVERLKAMDAAAKKL